MDHLGMSIFKPEDSWQVELIDNPGQLQPFQIVMLPQEHDVMLPQEHDATRKSSDSEKFFTCSHCGQVFSSEESLKVKFQRKPVALLRAHLS